LPAAQARREILYRTAGASGVKRKEIWRETIDAGREMGKPLTERAVTCRKEAMK